MATLSSTTDAVTTTTTTTPLEDSNTTTTLSSLSSTTQTSTELISSTNATSTTTSTTPGDEEPNVGAIVGGVVGGVVVLVVIALVVIFILRRRCHKRRKKQAKQSNSVPPSVLDLQKLEIKKQRWSERQKPDAISNNTQSSGEPQYVNEEPSYVKPEPPTRELYSGPYSMEYYMENNTTNTNQEVYSEPKTPELRQTKNFPIEDAPNPPNTNSGLESSKEQELITDYENVPKKRTEPPKADLTQIGEVEEDEEQTVYENQR